MPTWQCTASCKDCGTFSTPHNKIQLALCDILGAIECASREGFSVVVFTGGEATLRWNDLISGIKYARKLGLSTRLVTNAWWAKSNYIAKKHMESLHSAGLNEINFSTGDEHAKFIPIESVVRAIAEAISLGFDPVLMIEVTSSAKVTRKLITESAIFLAEVGKNAKKLKITESPWMPLDPTKVESYPDELLANRSNLGQKSGCDSIFKTHTVQANGRIGVCCGLGMQAIDALQIGKFESNKTSFMNVQQEAESDLVKLLIRQIGPERVLAKTSELNPDIQWENMYAHKCQACIRVFSDKRVIDEILKNEEHILTELATSMVIDRLLVTKPVSTSATLP